MTMLQAKDIPKEEQPAFESGVWGPWVFEFGAWDFESRLGYLCLKVLGKYEAFVVTVVLWAM